MAERGDCTTLTCDRQKGTAELCLLAERTKHIYTFVFYAQSTSAVIAGRLAERRPAERIYVAERSMPQIFYIYMNDRENETAELLIIIKVFVNGKILSVETILSA